MTGTRKSKADLQRILAKIEGQEGQTARARAIKAELEQIAIREAAANG